MTQPLFNREEWQKWTVLPEPKKIAVNVAAVDILLEVAKQELEYISEWKSIPTTDKEIGHVYVFNTVQTFWDNVGFLLYLNEDRFANFGFYPARACMETFLQFFHFCKQDQNTKDEIALKELIRPTIRLHIRDKQEGIGEHSYGNFYTAHADKLKLPPLSSITENNVENFERQHLKTFPGMRQLCKEYDENQVGILYFLYQYLCESAHGKILSNIVREHSSELEEYRRALMIIFRFAKDILPLLDRDFLDSRFKPDVQNAITSANKTLRLSIL